MKSMQDIKANHAKAEADQEEWKAERKQTENIWNKK
jgi:hypothetical protein